MRPYLLPLTLIALISLLLLALDASDVGSNRGPVKVAIVQPASVAAIDESVKGIVQALADRGYVDGRKVSLTFLNAHGDGATAQDIARQVTNGSVDLIVTSGTLAMQSVANANRKTKVPHVFGVTADAASAGIGVSATDPLDHPPWLTGYTSLVPVRPALDLAREFNPGLRKLGLVWHTAELSSQLYTQDARKAAQALGIELIEANAESTVEVGPAAQSLVSRQVDAILVTADIVVITAVDQVIKAARAARIPVITVTPPNFRKGALFDLGNDYRSLGYEVGERVASVLDGTPIPKLPIENRVPLSLQVNLTALDGLRDPWRAPADLFSRAQRVIDKDGERTLR